VYQWGSFGRGEIRGWMVASDTGYTFPSLPLKPRLGVKANIASGDEEPADQDLQTFNHLFPKGSSTPISLPAGFSRKPARARTWIT